MSNAAQLPTDIEACHCLIEEQDSINQSLVRELEKAIIDTDVRERLEYVPARLIVH